MREKKDNQVGKESMKRRHPVRQQLLAVFLGVCLAVVSIPISQPVLSVQAAELQEDIENFQLSEEERGQKVLGGGTSLQEGFVTSDNGEGSAQGEDDEGKGESVRQGKLIEEEDLLLFAEGEEELPATPTEPGCGIVSENVTWTTRGTLADGELVVRPGVTLTINDTISISGNVTIKGGGTIARGSTQGGFVMREESSLTVEAVTMDGKADVIGESVSMITLNGNNNLTLESGCIIRNCRASNGGGIYVYGSGSKVTLKNATIEGCSASSSSYYDGGGGIYVYGSGSKVTLDNATIEGCSAFKGGGIYVYGSNAEVIMDNATIESCSATSGGGIYAAGTQVEVTLNNATIEGCSASYGGGIYATGTGSQVTLNNAMIEGCSAASYGGGIYVTSSNTEVIMDNATIKNCSASGSGGGINVEGTQVEVIMDNATIENCSASGNGGGIFVTGSNVEVIMDNATIRDCSAYAGGGIRTVSSGGKVTLNNATIRNCLATDTSGGGISAFFGEVTINGGCYEGNQAIGTTSDISGFHGGGFIYTCRGTLTINDGLFIGNSNAVKGGCIYHCGHGKTHTVIKGGTFLGNTCSNETYKGSGAFHNSTADVGVTSVTLSGDVKFGDGSDDSGTDGIYLDVKDLTERKVQISDTLTYPIKLFLKPREGYVIAQGVNQYQLLRERDMKKITFIDVSDSGKTWYAVLNDSNQIYTSEIDPGYGYCVYYVKNGAKGIASTDDTQYELGADVTVKSAEGLSYEGRQFAGWNTQADGGGTTYWPGDSFQIQGDTDLFAIFKEPITAGFYSGSERNKETVPAVMDWDAGNGTLTVPELEPIDGFTAVGWSKSPDSFEAEIEEGEEITLTENAVYYGVYEKEVTLSYNANGGDTCPEGEMKVLRANVNEEEVTYDIPEFTAGEAAKKGAVFLGWSMEAEESNVEYQKDDTFGLDHDVTLYAIFEDKLLFSADFYSGSARNKETVPAVMDRDAGNGTLTVPGLEPIDGFTAAGWSRSPDSFEAEIEEGGKITLTEDGVFYGVYQKDVTLSYDANGGANCPAYETKVLRANVNEEEVSYDIPEFTIAAAITKAGYVFAGWNTERDGDSPHWQAGESRNLDRDTKLYAMWAAGDGTLYRVEHYRQDLEGDTYTRADDDTEYLAAKMGTKVTAAAKSYTGYTLNTNPGVGKAEGTVEADGSLVLQLYYDRNVYEIEFDLNGGWGTVPEKQFIRYGGLLQAVEEPHRTGYTLKGWNADPEGMTSACWEIRQPVEDNTDSLKTTLYAAWADETAPVLGEASFGTGYRNLADWVISRKKLTITVPVTEEGSGLKQGDYRLESADGSVKEGSAVIHTQQAVAPQFQARSGGLDAVMTIRGNARSGEGTAEITIEEDFKGSVRLTCTDHAGNPSVEKILTADGAGVIVEDNAPDIRFSKAAEEAVNGSAALNVDVTDTAGEHISGGIAAVSYRIDGGKEETEGGADFAGSIVENYHFTADIKGEGEHTLAVAAVDNAGNESVKEVTVEIKGTEVADAPTKTPPKTPTKTPPKTPTKTTVPEPETQAETSVPEKAGEEPATGEAASVEISATLGMIAGFTYLMLYFTSGENGITEKEKREIISRLVHWAKGGRLRKYLALIIIWLFLAYYHSIGKSVDGEWREVCKG